METQAGHLHCSKRLHARANLRQDANFFEFPVLHTSTPRTFGRLFQGRPVRDFAEQVAKQGNRTKENTRTTVFELTNLYVFGHYIGTSSSVFAARSRAHLAVMRFLHFVTSISKHCGPKSLSSRRNWFSCNKTHVLCPSFAVSPNEVSKAKTPHQMSEGSNQIQIRIKPNQTQMIKYFPHNLSHTHVTITALFPRTTIIFPSAKARVRALCTHFREKERQRCSKLTRAESPRATNEYQPVSSARKTPNLITV